jgi:hypothetical protein
MHFYLAFHQRRVYSYYAVLGVSHVAWQLTIPPLMECELTELHIPIKQPGSQAL